MQKNDRSDRKMTTDDDAMGGGMTVGIRVTGARVTRGVEVTGHPRRRDDEGLSVV